MENTTRADLLVRQAFPGLSRSQIEEAFTQGWVRAEQGGALAKGDKLPAGARLETSALKAQIERARTGAAGLQVPVVYESAEIWVVDKPAGMPGHPLKLTDDSTLTHWAFQQLPSVCAEFPETQPTITPHRLDTGTSGLQIVCKTAKAYADWRLKFTAKKVRKSYHAWCWGVPKQEAWVVQLPIGKAPGGLRQIEGTDPRPARSEITVVEKLADRFLARVKCTTGVTHQVRVHLAASGYPLVGDASYDPSFATRSEKPPWHQLRAVSLACEGWGVTLDGVEKD